MPGGGSQCWRHLRLLAVVLTAAFLVLAGSQQIDAARAGSYLSFVCHDDAGAAMPADLVTRQNHGGFSPEYFRLENSCAGNGQGSLDLVVGGCAGCWFGALGISTLMYAPAGVTISSYGARFASATAACQVTDNRCISGQGETFGIDGQHAPPNYAFHLVGQGLGGPYEIGAAGMSADNLQFYAGCNAAAGGCRASSTVAALRISSLRAVLDDHTSPQVFGFGGALVSGRPLAGTQAANYTAQDTGGGIYADHVYVDGNLVQSAVIDSNGGRCIDHGTVPGMHSFGYVQPCKASVTPSVALDTTQFADGDHKLKIDVEDAAGDRAVVYDGLMAVANGAASASALALTLSGAAGRGGVNSAAGGCAPAASSSLSRGSGSGALLTVHLTCGARAMSNTPATIADDRGFRRQLQTDSGGDLQLAVPHPRSHLTVTVSGVTLALTARLRAISFSISPHVTRNRHSMRWRGVVSDARPGMKLLLEVRKGSAWSIFDQTTVDRSGHFSYRYKFRTTSGTVRYVFRVVARDGSAASPPRSILVRA